MKKKLTLSKKDRKMQGVLGGIAEYFDIDATIVRIGFVVLSLLTAIIPCVIAYFVISWVMPEV